MRLGDCYPNVRMEKVFMNTENSKTCEPHKFVLNLSQRLDWRSSNENATLQNSTPESMKPYEEYVISLEEVVEVVLVQCNLADNLYQQKSELSYIFTLNKSYAYLLNVEPNNLVFLKTYNTDDITNDFYSWSGRPIEIEYKVNLTMFINE